MTIREDARTNEERALLTDEEKLKVLIRIVDDDEEVREALTFCSPAEVGAPLPMRAPRPFFANTARCRRVAFFSTSACRA